MFGKFVLCFGLQKFAQSWSDKNAYEVLISSVIEPCDPEIRRQSNENVAINNS
jgi:hypothetical protein